MCDHVIAASFDAPQQVTGMDVALLVGVNMAGAAATAVVARNLFGLTRDDTTAPPPDPRDVQQEVQRQRKSEAVERLKVVPSKYKEADIGGILWGDLPLDVAYKIYGMCLAMQHGDRYAMIQRLAPQAGIKTYYLLSHQLAEAARQAIGWGVTQFNIVAYHALPQPSTIQHSKGHTLAMVWADVGAQVKLLKMVADKRGKSMAKTQHYKYFKKCVEKAPPARHWEDPDTHPIHKFRSALMNSALKCNEGNRPYQEHIYVRPSHIRLSHRNMDQVNLGRLSGWH
jgi:hypothetical protein